jgi:O-methyltransferase
MPGILKTYVRPLLHTMGIDVVRHRDPKLGAKLPKDFDEDSARIFRAVEPYTMTGPERVYSLLRAVEYVVSANIPGDFVECGVWRGGSTMAMALTLLKLGVRNRRLHLYDTYSGMNAPTDIDVSIQGEPAETEFQRTKTSDDASTWCYSSLDEVRRNVFSTGYPADQVHFIQGKVEDTIPGHIPSQIALLRLDTDWYESTKHEMTHLFPLLAPRGVLLIDDYGHWAGARKAVDEYLAEHGISMLLNRVDYTARIGVKA